MIPVDDKALRDKRITHRLARKLSVVLGIAGDAPDLARRYALGAMLDVWQLCHDRESPVVSAEEIDAAAQVEGFAALLVGAGLACEHPDGIYIAGARDRIPSEASDPTSENAESSYARARTRVRAPVRTGTHAYVPAPAYLSLSESGDRVHGVQSVQDPEQVEHDEHAEQEGVATRRRVTRAEILPVTDAFMSRFEVEYGKKPHWTSREIKQVKDLVRQHGVPEVVRRIHVLFDDPPRWLRPPFTMGTLVSQFDACVVGASTTTRRRDVSVGRYEPTTEPGNDDRPPWELNE